MREMCLDFMRMHDQTTMAERPLFWKGLGRNADNVNSCSYIVMAKCSWDKLEAKFYSKANSMDPGQVSFACHPLAHSMDPGQVSFAYYQEWLN